MEKKLLKPVRNIRLPEKPVSILNTKYSILYYLAAYFVFQSMFLANLPLYKKLTRMRSLKFARYLAGLIPEGSYVLDFGCGNMFTSLELLQLKPTLRINGMDVIRDQNLNEELMRDPRIEFTLLQTRSLPFADNTFDVSFALAVMHHTDDPEFYLSELSRVTKPSGSVILIEEMYINPLDRVWISGQDWILNKMKNDVPVPLNFRSHRHYLDEFKKQGLNIVKEDGIRAFPTGMHVYVYQLKKAG